MSKKVIDTKVRDIKMLLGGCGSMKSSMSLFSLDAMQQNPRVDLDSTMVGLNPTFVAKTVLCEQKSKE